MGSPLTLVLLLTVLGQAAPQYPPPYPRPGTTPLFENTAVAVWDVAWLKQKYPLHTHRYDLIGVSYVEGDRIITQGDAPGRQTPTRPWVFQSNVAGNTHVEEGASDPPMRAVLMEVKAAAPRTGCDRSSARHRGTTAGPTAGRFHPALPWRTIVTYGMPSNWSSARRPPR